MSNLPNQPAVPVRRRGNAPKPPSRPLPGWIDWLVFAVALAISAAAVLFTAQNQAFSVSIAQDQLWSWHLIRSCGLVAYTMLAASTLWGVFLSSRAIKDWASGPLSLLLHAATSWLALIFSMAHALLLLVDHYYNFQPLNLVIPFTGPYSPGWTGLGTISLWLMLVITLSFSVRKLIGQRSWQLLHYTSYLMFVLVTGHALFAGTDAQQPGLQIVLIGFFVLVTGLLIARIVQASRRQAQKT